MPPLWKKVAPGALLYQSGIVPAGCIVVAIRRPYIERLVARIANGVAKWAEMDREPLATAEWSVWLGRLTPGTRHVEERVLLGEVDDLEAAADVARRSPVVGFGGRGG